MNNSTFVSNWYLLVTFRRDSTFRAFECKEIRALFIDYLENWKGSTKIF